MQCLKYQGTHLFHLGYPDFTTYTPGYFNILLKEILLFNLIIYSDLVCCAVFTNIWFLQQQSALWWVVTGLCPEEIHGQQQGTWQAFPPTAGEIASVSGTWSHSSCFSQRPLAHCTGLAVLPTDPLNIFWDKQRFFFEILSTNNIKQSTNKIAKITKSRDRFTEGYILQSFRLLSCKYIIQH